MSLVYNPKTETYVDNTTTAVASPTDNTVTAVLEPPKAIRKKRAPKHDFGDGRGRVHAHRHDNGKGWVEDTAKVSEDVYVGPGAQIANYARVFGGVRLEAKASIIGYATVFNNTKMHGTARISGHAVVNGGELFANAVVAGDAELTNSQLFDVSVVRGSTVAKGCQFRGRTNVSGNVFLTAVSTNGFVHIAGNVSILTSNLRGLVAVDGHAHLHSATIENFMWACSGFKPEHFMAKLDLIRPEYVVHIKDQACVQAGSRITTPVTVSGHALLHNCVIGWSDLGLSYEYIFKMNEALPVTYDKPTIRDAVWRNANIRDRGGLDMLLSGDHSQHQSMTVPTIRPEQTRSPFSLESMSRGRRVQPI